MPFFLPVAPPSGASQGGAVPHAHTLGTVGALGDVSAMSAMKAGGPAGEVRSNHTGSSAEPAGPAAQELAALAGASPLAIEPIYRRESARAYRYALALCGNEAWAADATQEAFVALALRPTGFDAAKGSLGAYLAGVARHALAKTWRQARHETTLDSEEEPADPDGVDEDEQTSQTTSPESLLQRAQDGAAVWRALRQLPTIFREAVVLVDLQERPYAEAAAIAGIELNTLRTRLHRARARLATLLRNPQDHPQ